MWSSIIMQLSSSSSSSMVSIGPVMDGGNYADRLGTFVLTSRTDMGRARLVREEEEEEEEDTNMNHPLAVSPHVCKRGSAGREADSPPPVAV